jgi:hypothetical protein
MASNAQVAAPHADHCTINLDASRKPVPAAFEGTGMVVSGDGVGRTRRCR